MQIGNLLLNFPIPGKTLIPLTDDFNRFLSPDIIWIEYLPAHYCSPLGLHTTPEPLIRTILPPNEPAD